MSEINKTHITSLSITKPYKALKIQEWNNIPQFVVLTGENGSGKSTLFGLLGSFITNKHALNNTSSYCKIDFNSNVIKWDGYSYQNPPFLLVDDMRSVDNSSLLLDMVFKLSIELQHISHQNILEESVNIGRVNKIKKYLEEIFQDSFENIEPEIEKIQKIPNESAYKVIDAMSLKYRAIFLPRFGVDYLHRIINDGYKNLSTYLFNNLIKKTIKKEDIKISYDDYRKLDIGAEVLDRINITLQKYGFKYKIEYKIDDINTSTQVNIVLKNTKTNKEIGVGELSSGEHAILNLLTAAVSKNSQVGKSIILLDEPDARLNPKMTKTLFKVIKEVLVDEYGLQVILTTHNPVTVYKAQQEGVNIFKMEEGKLLIDKEGKSTIADDEIINSLLDGIITLDNFSNMFKEVANKKNILLVEGKTDVLHLQSAIKKLNGKHGIDINLDKLAIIPIGGEQRLASFIKSYPSEIFKDKNIVALFDNDDAGRKCKSNLSDCYKGDKGNEDKTCYVYTLKTPDGYKNIEIGNGKTLNIKENKSTVVIEKLYEYELIKSFLSSKDKEIIKLLPKSLNKISENQIGDDENIPDHIMFWCNKSFIEYKNSFAEHVKENDCHINFENFIPILICIQEHFS